MELNELGDRMVRGLANTTDPAKLGKQERTNLVKKGQALPSKGRGGRFPIRNRADLQKAIKAIGRAKGDKAKIRAYIIRRAKALGAEDAIPDGWKSGGGLAHTPLPSELVELAKTDKDKKKGKKYGDRKPPFDWAHGWKPLSAAAKKIARKRATGNAAAITKSNITVKPGDTVSGLAKRAYGSASQDNIRKLVKANNIADPDVIKVGQKLAIPGKNKSSSGEPSGEPSRKAPPTSGPHGKPVITYEDKSAVYKDGYSWDPDTGKYKKPAAVTRKKARQA